MARKSKVPKDIALIAIDAFKSVMKVIEHGTIAGLTRIEIGQPAVSDIGLMINVSEEADFFLQSNLAISFRRKIVSSDELRWGPEINLSWPATVHSVTNAIASAQQNLRMAQTAAACDTILTRLANNMATGVHNDEWRIAMVEAARDCLVSRLKQRRDAKAFLARSVR